MKTHMQTDGWIRWTKLALSLILVVSIADLAISALTRQPIPGLLIALGFVSGAGLGKPFDLTFKLGAIAGNASREIPEITRY